MFDAVIGDPPYGVRAGGRKSSAREVTIRDRATHIPATDPYSLGECLRDLLDLAAQTLVVREGGREGGGRMGAENKYPTRRCMLWCHDGPGMRDGLAP